MTAEQARQASYEAYQRAAESAADANTYAIVLWIALVFGVVAVAFLAIDMRRWRLERERVEAMRRHRIVERYAAETPVVRVSDQWWREHGAGGVR